MNSLNVKTDGSALILLKTFPEAYRAVLRSNTSYLGTGKAILPDVVYGCRKWVRDVHALCGTQYTIRNLHILYRRGRKLNSRMVMCWKRYLSLMPKLQVTQ